MKKIVCISDTHVQHRSLNLPEGDILIHAGDISRVGKLNEIIEFNSWLGTLNYKHKIIIAGNHDFIFENDYNLSKSLITNAIYLEDSGVEIEEIKFWGSPVSPRFYDWAFNRDRGEDINKHWAKIPKNIDVLITHGPPYGILDKTVSSENVGC
ncbi:MAG: metallophosphatase domain-containing protein [Candidatus Sericytochromatia bacterium]